MSEIKALKKLRAAGRNMAKGRNLENHEECNLLLVIADEIEAEIAERFMELPVDRSGNPWHVGDKFPLGDMDGGGHVCTVSGVSADEVFFYYDEHSSSSKHRHFKADKLVHYRPRTIEDIIYEIALDSVEVQKVIDGVPVLGIDRGQLADGLEIHADEIRSMFGGDAS